MHEVPVEIAGNLIPVSVQINHDDAIPAQYSPGQGGGGTNDYTDLNNKPQINGVTLDGDKSGPDLGLISSPSSVSSGDFLTWNGSSWVGTTLGTVFTVKGEVATVADLPPTGNTIGDVYYVSAVSVGYIWLETTDHPAGYWEELGEPIDLSGYIAKPSSPSSGDVLTWSGAAWAADAPHYIPSGGASGQVLKKSSATDYAVEWANESGGGTERAWSLLATVDCTQVNGDISLNNLDDFTEFMIFADKVQNATSTASGFILSINSTAIAQGAPAIAKTGTNQYQWTYMRYDGMFWHTEAVSATINTNYKPVANQQAPYAYFQNVGKATSFSMGAAAAQYRPNAGTIKIWGR